MEPPPWAASPPRKSWQFKHQSSHSKNTVVVGPLSKALNPTLLPGGIGAWGGSDREITEMSRNRQGRQDGKRRMPPPPLFNMAVVSAVSSAAPIGD
ncbi:hypothetical protein JZ751_026920 [Albula glossodonta]|uniref:Uncharacterized protein n=1 Tax=Albula glossodonta TaxID=121402 RepID=A0A8T2PDB9_9TELE|nr:hypothetical protein JZ751_026920 [Albula glossodonta]